jgi:hypothetical protein
MKSRRLIVGLTVLGALTLAPAAFAQSTGTGYGGQGGVAGQVSPGGSVAGQVGQGGEGPNVAGSTATGSSGPAASQPSGGNRLLAFTGMDLALLAGGGLLLIGSGWALSRLVARNSAV